MAHDRVPHRPKFRTQPYLLSSTMTRVTLESASASNFSAKANKSTITFSTSGIFAGFDPSSPSAKQSTYIMCSYTTSSIYGPVNHHNQAGLGSMRETFGKERGEDLPWHQGVWKFGSASGWRKPEIWHTRIPLHGISLHSDDHWTAAEISYTFIQFHTHVASAELTQNHDFQDFVVPCCTWGSSETQRGPARQCQKIIQIRWRNGQTGCQASRSRPGQFRKHGVCLTLPYNYISIMN